MTSVIDSNIKIKTYDFSPEKLSELKSNKRGINWPVVYVLHNDKGLYVGETSSAIGRMNEHSKTEKKKLKNIEIIFDDTFNKSSILDIEQNLIKLFNADGKFTLWNQNGGQSTMHDYYQREAYVSKIEWIMRISHDTKEKFNDYSQINIEVYVNGSMSLGCGGNYNHVECY